jgi:hypothetical protein
VEEVRPELAALLAAQMHHLVNSRGRYVLIAGQTANKIVD